MDSIRESFRSFRDAIDRAEEHLEMTVLGKVEELETRIKALELEVARMSSGAPPARKPVGKSASKQAATSTGACQSASADARKLYGDIRPGDITHEKVQLRFVEFFTKTRRTHTSVLLKYGNTPHQQHLPCCLLQLAYDHCQEHLIDCLLSELLCTFFNEHGQGLVMENSKLQDILRVLKLLARTTADFQELESTLHDKRIAKKRVTELLRAELMKLFQEPDSSGLIQPEEPEVWESRTGAFGIMLGLLQQKYQPPLEPLIERITRALSGPGKRQVLPQKFSYVPDLLSECVSLCWDMVTLNPPAIVCQPTCFKEEWFETRAANWVDSDGSLAIQVYYRPILFYSARLDVAVKGEVGNVIHSMGHPQRKQQ